MLLNNPDWSPGVFDSMHIPVQAWYKFKVGLVESTFLFFLRIRRAGSRHHYEYHLIQGRRCEYLQTGVNDLMASTWKLVQKVCLVEVGSGM